MRNFKIIPYSALPVEWTREYGDSFENEVFLAFYEGQEVTFVYHTSQLVALVEQIRAIQIDTCYNGPTAQECAGVAHEVAAENWKLYDSTLEKQDKLPFLELARDYDDIAVKFLDGLKIYPIITKSAIIAFKVRGARGDTYNLSPSGERCRCSAGLRGVTCWHSRAVKVWLATNRALHDRQDTNSNH